VGFFASQGATAQANYSIGFGELDVSGDGAWGSTMVFSGGGYAGGDAVQFYVRSSESEEYVIEGESYVADPAGGIRIELLLSGTYAPGSYSVVVTGKTIDNNDLQLTASFDVTTSPTTTAAPVTTVSTTAPQSSTSSPPSTVVNQTGSTPQTSAPSGSDTPAATTLPSTTAPVSTLADQDASLGAGDAGDAQTLSAADEPGDDDGDLGALVDHAANQSGNTLPGDGSDTATAAGPADAGGAESSGFIVWMVFAGLLVLLLGGYWRVRRGSWIG